MLIDLCRENLTQGANFHTELHSVLLSQKWLENQLCKRDLQNSIRGRKGEGRPKEPAERRAMTQ
jgi:hypothetical protein